MMSPMPCYLNPKTLRFCTCLGNCGFTQLQDFRDGYIDSNIGTAPKNRSKGGIFFGCHSGLSHANTKSTVTSMYLSLFFPKGCGSKCRIWGRIPGDPKLDDPVQCAQTIPNHPTHSSRLPDPFPPLHVLLFCFSFTNLDSSSAQRIFAKGRRSHSAIDHRNPPEIPGKSPENPPEIHRNSTAAR